VREGESVFVWFSSFADTAAHASHQHACAAEPLIDAWIGRLDAPSETLRLTPTPRSLLRGLPPFPATAATATEHT
jgi:hypothetical protein